MDVPNDNDGNLTYRAALVSIGVLYEDYDGPLSPELIESAKRIIAERERRKAKLAESERR